MNTAPGEGARHQRLFDHLAEEFLEHGVRAVEFLATAARLLDTGLTAPRIAETVCYCVREALKEIPQAGETPPRQPWRAASRAVVDARRRYDIATSLPGHDPTATLQQLLQVIDDLDLVHSQERIHQQRLLAVLAARTGVSPPPAEPVEAYQRLIDRLDDSLHSATTLDDARGMYEHALRLISQLFMPPELRLPELAELGQIAHPTAEDVSRLMELVASPRHLEYFFARAISVEWLDRLDTSDILAPPAGQGLWPLFRLVDRYKGSAAEAIASWLMRAFRRWGDDPTRAWFIARAARDLGPAGNEVMLGAVGTHPSSSQIAHLAVAHVQAADPRDAVVVKVADHLFNASSGLDESYGLEQISEALHRGVTPDNWQERIALLVFKLQAVGDDDRFLSLLRHDQVGSIADRPEIYDDDRSAVVLHGLIETLTASRASGATGEELLAAIDPLRDDLRPRVRSWVLSQSMDVGLDALVAEVSEAVATRHPSGDDVHLLDRINALSVGAVVDTEPWRAALGPPPSPESIGTALADESVDEAWIRAMQWAALLPAEVSVAWAKPLAVLRGAFGQLTREGLTTRQPVVVGVGTSPLSEAELSAMPVREAARWIAQWRPDPNAWMVGSRELARTLEAVIKQSPDAWTESPLEMISLLREPIYVSHYFRGLCEAEALNAASAADGVEAIAFARTHPWTPNPMGRDDWDWDPTWANADDDGVSLLRRLADKDIGFGDRSEQAWDITLEAATTPDEPGTGDEPLTAAINRHKTRAVEAIFSLMAWQYRQTNEVRPEAVAVLDNALRIPGRDGEQHRAIIAPRLPFLLYVAPHWVDERTSLIFGDDAPSELAQATVDLYLQWGRPNRWVFEHVVEQAVDAIRRSVRNALDSVLIAMLWRIDGYGVDSTVELLAEMGDDVLSRAGEKLGRLLRHDDVDAEHVAIAVRFFERAMSLNRPAAIFGFGWFAEIRDLHDETWLELTASAARLTHGRLDWGHKVADRAAASNSVRGLEILNDLVRGLEDDWDRGHVMEKGLAALRNASDHSDDAFRRLRTSLLERGIFDAEDL